MRIVPKFYGRHLIRNCLCRPKKIAGDSPKIDAIVQIRPAVCRFDHLSLCCFATKLLAPCSMRQNHLPTQGRSVSCQPIVSAKLNYPVARLYFVEKFGSVSQNHRDFFSSNFWIFLHRCKAYSQKNHRRHRSYFLTLGKWSVVSFCAQWPMETWLVCTSIRAKIRRQNCSRMHLQ